MDFGERINVLKRLIYPDQIESVMQEEEKKATLKKGMTIVLLAILLNSLISFSMKMIEAQVVKSTVDSLAKDYNIINTPKVINDQYIQSAAMSFLVIGIPLMFISVLVMQGVAYKLLEALGGKGKFDIQFYFAAHILLIPAIASIVLPLLILVPCINVVALLAFMIFGLYITFYVHGKMLTIVHNISWPNALLATTVSLIASGILYMGIMLLLMKIGVFPELPEYIDAQVN
jgi:hypothetical protein